MALTKCAHGHLYDTDLYASCPYCNSTQPVIEFQNMQPQGNWGGSCGTYGVPVGAGGHTQPPPGYGGAQPSRGTPMNAAGHTQPPPGYGAQSPMGSRVSDVNKTRPPAGYTPPAPPVPSGRKVSEDQVTRAQMVADGGRELVVGWLVCIQGKEKGADYHIFGKVNTIGRDKSNDIVIPDPKISRERHVRLGYDPRGNAFHLIPEQNSNNIYLNGSAVYTVMPLHAYDVIELGDTMLAFMPFCSGAFTWETGVRTDLLQR